MSTSSERKFKFTTNDYIKKFMDGFPDHFSEEQANPTGGKVLLWKKNIYSF